MHTITGTEAIRAILDYFLKTDENVLLLGEDIGVYGGAFGVTKGLVEKYGRERVIDTPISEASFIGAATGMAMMSLRPIVEIMFMDFLTLAFDQILNHATKFHFMFNGQLNVPMVIRTPAGAGSGYGPSHSQSLCSLFAHVPGIEIIVPSSPLKMAGLLKTAVLSNKPTLFVEHKLIYNQKQAIPVADLESFSNWVKPIPFKKVDIVRSGKDMTVFAYLNTVNIALEAAEELADQDIEIEIIDPQTLSPFDEVSIVESIKKTGKLLIFEEEHGFCSFGSQVAFLAANKCLEYLTRPVEKLAAYDMPIPAGKELERMVMPNKKKFMKKVKATMAS
jgi:pyruvate/2-oxoglutarate/acetoin dehydrogenase E1 component